MRQELADKIMTRLAARGITDPDIMSDLIIAMNDYEITVRETALAVRDEDKNEYFLKKFIISKTVKGCTKRTLEFYTETMRYVLSAINKTADEITTDDIRMYIALRIARDKVSKTTAGNDLRVMRSFYNFLYREELIQTNPMNKVDSIKKEKTKKEAFTEMEVERLRAACRDSRETAIIEILLSTGCRVTELVSIKVEDVRKDELIVHGKGDKDRTVYLNARTIIAVETYLNERSDTNPYLFPASTYAESGIKPPVKGKQHSWWKNPEYVSRAIHANISTIECSIRKMGRKLGIEAHPHKFRRTCATFALRRGMSIEQVSKMLGHESIATTQIYLDLSDRDLKRAHEKYVV